MRKAQQAAVAGRPFVELLYRIQREATIQMGEFHHPLLEVREVRRRAIILVGADKGLCGALNTNLFRLVAPYDTKTTVFITAGRKAAQFVSQSGRLLQAQFAYSGTPRFAEAAAIAACGRDLFLKGEVDQVLVAATRFVNTLTQSPLIMEFLPVGEIKALKIPNMESEEELKADNIAVKFEPSAEDVVGYLLSHYVDIYIHQVLLNAKASEQSARLVSMKNATDSANHLIRELSLEYNTLRQGNITKELLEIAGGQTS
jgi:F-type H+-transporting ATPase subunit gamma